MAWLSLAIRLAASTPPAGNVPQSEHEMILVERYDLVPVASDICLVRACDVPSGSLDPTDLRERLRKDGMLQRLGDAPLLGIELPVLVGESFCPSFPVDEEISPHRRRE
jgi:hypothetical protein